MDRRTYLALTGAAFTLAGCGGGDDDAGTTTSEVQTETATDTETETETETDPEPDPASFEVTSVYAPDKVNVGEEYRFSIAVQNTGEQPGVFSTTVESRVVGVSTWEVAGTITTQEISPGKTFVWESEPVTFDQPMTVQYRLGATEWQSEVLSTQPDVQIEAHDLVMDQGEYTTDVYVAATITNNGDAATSRISVTVNWFDEAGEYIDDALGTCHALGVGETWAAQIAFFGEPDRVGDYEISIDSVGGPPTTPDGVAVTDSRLLIGDDDAKVTGTVENGYSETLDYLEAAVKFYDGDGVVLFTEYTNETTVTAGETWDFEVESLLVDRLNQIESYEVVLSASIY